MSRARVSTTGLTYAAVRLRRAGYSLYSPAEVEQLPGEVFAGRTFSLSTPDEISLGEAGWLVISPDLTSELEGEISRALEEEIALIREQEMALQRELSFLSPPAPAAEISPAPVPAPPAPPAPPVQPSRGAALLAAYEHPYDRAVALASLLTFALIAALLIAHLMAGR